MPPSQVDDRQSPLAERGGGAPAARRDVNALIVGTAVREARDHPFEDSLLDGCYQAFAARPRSDDDESDGSAKTWTIRNVLAWVRPQTGVYKGPSPGNGSFFKWDTSSDARSPRVAIHDTILRIDQYPNHTEGGLWVPPGKLASCSNVTIVWLGQTNTALIAMIVTEVWQWTPFMFLVLLAGLAGISPELYEAASIDGANWWQSLRHITLPALAPVIAVALLFRGLDAFKFFDTVFIFTQGGPGTSTETISWYIYQIGFKFFRMGYASALAWILFVIILSLTLVQLWLSRKWVHYENA